MTEEEPKRRELMKQLGLLGGGTGLTVVQEVENLVKFALGGSVKPDPGVGKPGLSRKTLIIYHHPCADGFTAAWVVAKAHGYDFVDLHPAQYGSAPPDVKNRDVIVVDFSYPRAVLEAMDAEADSLLVLDHHKSAQKDLDGLPFAHFDMNKSGAMLAWDEFVGFGAKPAPLLVQYVQDRDIWTKAMPFTEEISAAIASRDLTFDEWDEMAQSFFGVDMVDASPLVLEGAAILRYVRKTVQIAADAAAPLYLAPHWIEDPVPGVCCDPLIRSDVGHALLTEGVPFSVTFKETPKGFTYSLRSDDSRADVSEIARKFGGGGHRNAAGFFSVLPVHRWQ